MAPQWLNGATWIHQRGTAPFVLNAQHKMAENRLKMTFFFHFLAIESHQ